MLPLLYMIGLCLSAAGCMSRPLTAEQLCALEQPPAHVVAKIDRFSAQALAWYNKTEAEMLAKGRPLTAEETAMAGRTGVTHPEQVRVVILSRLPMPDDPELLDEARKYGMGSLFEGGRTMGYAILLKPGMAKKPEVLCHELVHVAQMEKMGREGFLRRYFTEMMVVGYMNSPLEREAYATQKAMK